jgi:hypothetical protein
MSFAVIWIVIVVFTGVKFVYNYRKTYIEKKKEKVEPTSELVVVPFSDSVQSADKLAAKLREYLIAYLPSLYKNSKLAELSRQIYCDHKLFRVFFNNHDPKNAWKDSFHVLTLISANMFILALLFDAQYPVDDHTCEAFTEQQQCLKRQSFDGSY